MQGGKNRFLPKEMNANRFFWDSHGCKSGQTTFVPLWDRMEGAWLWTLEEALTVQRWNSLTYTFVGVSQSGHNLESSQT
jgi:hypothetical protein